MRQLRQAQSTAVLGVDPMQVEALAFAWLARQCFASEPGNLSTWSPALQARAYWARHIRPDTGVARYLAPFSQLLSIRSAFRRPR